MKELTSNTYKRKEHSQEQIKRKDLTYRCDPETRIYQNNMILIKHATQFFQYLLMIESIYFSSSKVN